MVGEFLYPLYVYHFIYPDIVRSLNTNICSTITDSFYPCKQSVQAKNFMFMYELDMAPQSSPRTARRHNANLRLYFRRQISFQSRILSRPLQSRCAHIMPSSHTRKEPHPCQRNSAVESGTLSPIPALPSQTSQPATRPQKPYSHSHSACPQRQSSTHLRRKLVSPTSTNQYSRTKQAQLTISLDSLRRKIMADLRIHQQQHMPLPPLMPLQPLRPIHLNRIRHPQSPPITQPVIHRHDFQILLPVLHPPQHVRPIPIPRPNIHNPPALRQHSHDFQRLETRAHTAEMVVQDRQQGVGDFYAVGGGFGAGPFEGLVGPG
jgi:hypothetical protein